MGKYALLILFVFALVLSACGVRFNEEAPVASIATSTPRFSGFGGKNSATLEPTAPVQQTAVPTPFARTEFYPNISGMGMDCPSDAEMQAAFGFNTRELKPVRTGNDATPWDPCKWTLQAVNDFVYSAVPFVPGWQMTVTLPNETVAVYYGDGVSRDILGASFRYMPNYAASPDSDWVLDPYELMARENRYGLMATDFEPRDPGYISYSGNLGVQNKCPLSVSEVSAAVGGDAADWAPLPGQWPGEAWVYQSRRGANLAVPTFGGWLDYSEGKVWIGEAPISAFEASYHCHLYDLDDATQHAAEFGQG